MSIIAADGSSKQRGHGGDPAEYTNATECLFPSGSAALYRRDPQRITLIGHSAGGDAAIVFAEYLNVADIPVSLLVTYDPTRFAHSVPPNVERYVNLYQSSNILGGGGDASLKAVVAMIRPETIGIVEAASALLSGNIDSVSFIGDRQRMVVRGAAGKFLTVDAPNTVRARAGERIGLLIAPDAIRLLPPEN